jgi:2-methylcitrate dehydratase PrpD
MDMVNETSPQPHDEATISLTGSLVRLIRTRTVTEHDLATAAGFALDTMANIVAGTNSAAGAKLLAWARATAPGGDLTGLDAGRQALLMGSLCHILEVDDLHRTSVVHPGCVVVPAMLALAAPSRRQGTGGRACLTALLHGYEAACRVGMAVGREHYRVWHNTATCGPFGSAMAASHLLGLDEEATVHALGNAGSQSAGLWEFIETGAETKHLHAGRGAEAGVVAAGLARFGFTGAPRILEGARGFFRAACPDAAPERLLEDADGRWQVHATSIKPWPSCRHTHPAIACALDIQDRMRRAGLSRDAISAVRVTAYQAALDVCDRPAPDSAYAAKFSLQHCVAAGLFDGTIDFASFEAAARERLARPRGLVALATGEPFQASYPGAWGSRVEATASDGRVVAAEVRHARGDPEAALSRAELIGKAESLLAHGGLKDPQRFVSTVLAMADGGPAPDLMAEIAALSRPGPHA